LGLQDAQKLINVARQAPFGKGEQTWELDPSQFSLSEKWQPYVDTLMETACEGLGVKRNDISAELYKMLVYEKGTMPKTHTDSEKSIILARVVDVEGHEIFRNIPVEGKDIVRIRPFKLKPNKSEYKEYTVDEGASAAHCYKDTVCTM
jgi:hypothetical protein